MCTLVLGLLHGWVWMLDLAPPLLSTTVLVLGQRGVDTHLFDHPASSRGVCAQSLYIIAVNHYNLCFNVSQD